MYIHLYIRSSIQVLESRENSAYVAQDLNNDYDDDDDDDYESGKSSSEEDVKERTKKKSVAVKTKTSAFRRVMDFASAQKKAANVQVSKKAKKRGQVQDMGWVGGALVARGYCDSKVSLHVPMYCMLGSIFLWYLF